MKGSLGAAPRSRFLEPCRQFRFQFGGLRPPQNNRWMWKSATATPSRHNASHRGIRLPILDRLDLQKTKEMPPEKDNLNRASFVIYKYKTILFSVVQHLGEL